MFAFTNFQNMNLKTKHQATNLLLYFATFSLLLIITQQQCLTYHEYYDSSQGSCLPCQYNCLTCLDNTICAACTDEFYLNDNSGQCLKCPFGCRTCNDSTTCVTCNTGMYIDASGNCIPCSTGVSSCSIAVIEKCHDQYFLLGGICAGCLDNCKTCEDFVTCTQCMIGYYLRADKQSCLQCSSNCQICTDATTCTSCSKGYTIVNNACALQDCSMFPFCINCNSLQCLSCEQGKYLSSSKTCIQGASILCQESVGPYYTNCEVDDYGCPNYAVVQTDPYTYQDISVCSPFSATQYAEYIYGTNTQSNCVTSTCGAAFNQLFSVTTRKSFYQVEYNLNIRLYKNPSHTINITILNKTTQAPVTSNIHTKSIALQLSNFAQSQPTCSSCPYGQVYLTGTLKSNGYQQTQFKISDSNGAFTIIQYVFKFSTCTIDKCETCTTVSDCTLCIQPYLLQLVKCVDQCDAGFYKYQRYCMLECPSNTFSIQSSYECQACNSPCKTCSSQTVCLSCVSGYFLEGSSCVLTCSSIYTFGNTTSNECETCPNPCSTCQAVNLTYVKCKSCLVGYLYIQQKCVFDCPLTLYNTFLNQISQCATCDSSCSQCYISGSTCSGCVNGYLLYSNYCNQTTYCSSGYFIATNNVCSPCQFPCATCSSASTNCTSCLKGSLYQFQCTTSCPSGFYTEASQISNITCQACTNNCLTCLSATLCQSCASGRFLYENQCLITCPNITYYANPSNNTCTECSPPCKQCTSASSCLSCATGYLDGTSCKLICNSSAFINTNFQCQQCTAPCIQCYSGTQCIKCQLPNILYMSGCITVTDCSNLGKYVAYTKNETTNALAYGQCRECTFPCATCQTSSIYCLTCVANYLYLSDLKTCVQKCPSSYYQSSNQCLKCSTSCYECSVSSTNCTSCSSGKYLNSLTNTCVSTCPDGYYADNQLGKCVLCVSPCATCYNIYFCKSCSVGIFYNKVCVTTCPSGTIFSSSTNECVFCTNNCLTCVGTTSNCTTCISGYFFIASNNTCSSTCPSTHYANSFTQACEICISPCATCTGAVECLTCVTNYYLSGKTCLASCPNKFFKNSATMTCDSCNLTICQTCTSNPNNCLTCAIGYFYDSISSKCVATCPTGYYPQTLGRTCKPCQFPCQACTNTSFCTQCESAYKLFSNRCYSSCPIGYFSTPANACQQCATNCQICSSLTNCTKCASSYYVQSGACVSACNQGLYKGKQDMTNYDYCIACPSNCQICQDFNTCNLCVSGFYLFNGLCLTECPILHYTDTTTLSCKSCPQNCVSCVNSTICNKCINSYMYQNQCYQTCPSRTYVFNEEQCNNCVSPCLQCQSQFTCITCITGYFYYHSYCVTACPQGVWYYPHNSSCAETCPYNKYEEKLICYVDGCGGKLVQLNGYCLNNCPTKYYVSKNESCVACESNQEICDELFVADLQVLRSQELTLVLYFSQQAEVLQSLSDVNITFADQNNLVQNLTLKTYEFTQYKLVFKYEFTRLNFITAYLTIPYLDSQKTNQAISVNYYEKIIYYFNNYESDKESASYTIGSYIPLLMTIGLFLTIVLNVIAKNSHYLQLLDFMQLIGACLYLDMQYPIFLEKFLHSMGYVLFTFMPKMLNHTPYAFSSPKYIFYNVDTSFSRTHLLTFLLFLILFIAMIVVVLVNKYKNRLTAVANRIKYRNLNDLFSILSFPLMLFSFSFFNSIPIDLLLGLIVIFITVGWIVFISNLIISAQEMGQLRGLLSDYEAVSSKLGLMYSPFSYIRRLIVALVFCVFPDRPLAALTLLLIFTILILICLFFYQPFESQITDYVSMYLEFTLILFILLIVIIGLDVLDEDSNKIVGMVGIVFVSLAMAVGLGWLIYLTVKGMKQFYENYGKNEEMDTEDCIKEDKKKSGEGSDKEQGQNKHQFYHYEGENQDSASNLVNDTRQGKNKYIMEDMDNISQTNSNKEEFKHWHDDDGSESGSQKQKQDDKRPPNMLMKKVLKQRTPDLTEANEQIN